jgi:hypothetical protein
MPQALNAEGLLVGGILGLKVGISIGVSTYKHKIPPTFKH